MSGSAGGTTKVALGINALLSSGVTDGKWTDDVGEASFNVKSNYGKIFVSGSTAYEGYLQGAITVKVAIEVVWRHDAVNSASEKGYPHSNSDGDF